jgi:bifunctional non-homologous end joining protein LigD
MAKAVPKSRRQYVKNSSIRAMAAGFEGAVGAPFPKFVEPALATLVDIPPKAENWVHEIKFDGYRLQIHKRAGEIRCYTDAATTGPSASACWWSPFGISMSTSLSSTAK